MTALRTLNVADCPRVDDVGLAHIGRRSTLVELYLDSTGITDSGLKELEGLPAIRELTLSACEGITDAGCRSLASLETLEYLSLIDCPNISERALVDLECSLPHCRIAR